jgi:hypothetical protein
MDALRLRRWSVDLSPAQFTAALADSSEWSPLSIMPAVSCAARAFPHPPNVLTQAPIWPHANARSQYPPTAMAAAAVSLPPRHHLPSRATNQRKRTPGNSRITALSDR